LKPRLFEIGLRKVLGANIEDHFRRFGKEIFKLLTISLVITLPALFYLKPIL